MPPLPGESTVPVRRRPLADTQPAFPPFPRPPVPAPPFPRASVSPRPLWPPALLLVLLTLFSFCGLVALTGYTVWVWVNTLPRTTVLLLGLDRRPDQGYTVRSDTMILLTAYPPGPRLAMLSIPRDLYVEVPGYGTQRINTAHFWGENEQEGGGPSLAMRTVEQDFGVPVQHYIRVDFDGFRAIVDAVGGVDVLVEEPVVDNAYPTDDYGTIRIEIPAGQQHMDGETALRYVRSRHGSSDFDRAARQQQVLLALARRLLQPEVWLQAPAVYQAVMEHLDTDLGPTDLLVLALVACRVGPDGIEHRVIDREMTTPWTTPTGGAVLLPRWEEIDPLVEEVFRP
jgi:LCP family protein required for cell wall assembly